MSYSYSKRLRSIRTKILNITTSVVLLGSSLGTAIPLFLSQTAYAASSTVCATTCDADTIQSAINAAKPGDTISFGGDATLNHIVNVNQALTIDGNGHTLYTNFFQTSTSNNAAIGVNASNVTINDLTVDGIASNKLHGINIYEATGVNLNNVTTENNGHDGVVVNGSTVTVNNITTKNNGWGGIDVDQGSGVTTPAILTVTGTSTHDEGLAPDIKIDDINKTVQVIDQANQYGHVNIGASRVFKLKPAAPTNLQFKAIVKGVPTTLACDSTVNSVFNNSLQFVWDDPSGIITAHRTLISYPDGGSKSAYTGSRNVWMGNITQYGYDNGFGEHGDGAYTYTVQAEDAYGIWGATASCTLYYDTHIPTATFTSAPAKNAYVNSNFVVSGTAQDNVRLQNVSFDVRSQDGSTWKAGCVQNTTLTYTPDRKNATISCTINTSQLVDGTTYMLRIHASDYAGYGNVNSDSQQFFTIDRTAPTVAITAPSNGQFVSVKNNGYKLNIAGTATDTNFNYYYCYVTNSSGEVGTSDPLCETAWALGTPFKTAFAQTTQGTVNGPLGSIDLTGVANGNYTVHVVAYDKAGNSAEATMPFVLDNTVPQIQIDGKTPPTPMAYYGIGDKVNTHVIDTNYGNTYVYTDNNGTLGSAPYKVYKTAAGSWFGLWWLPQGTYQIYSVDLAGNKSAAYTITIDTTAPAAPGTPTTNSPTNDDNVVWGWKAATDSGSGIKGYNYWLTSPTSITPYTTKFTTDKTVTTTVSTDGTYTLHVQAVDKAGNVGPESTGTVIVDTTPPVATLTTPDPTVSNNKGSGQYTVTGTVADANFDLSKTEFQVATDNNGVKGYPPTVYSAHLDSQSGDTYTVSAVIDTTTGMSNGVYNITLVSTDLAGNSSTAVENGLPVSPLASADVLVNNNSNSQQFTETPHVLGDSTTNPQKTENGNTNNGNTSGNVLGDSTTTPSTTTTPTTTNNGQVKGDSTSGNTSKSVSTNNNSNFLGLGWWWLLVLGVLLGFFWFVFGRANSDDKA